ncbi:MAG: hypothetical protein ACKOCV_00760 [Gemmatimonadota bacterium]
MMQPESLDPRDPAVAPEPIRQAPAAEAEDREIVPPFVENAALWSAIDAETARLRAMTAPAGFAVRVLAGLDRR